MNLSQRQKLVGGGAVLILALAAGSLWFYQRRRGQVAGTPAWTDPQQPPDGVAGEPTQLTAEQTWAANRCAPMTACCTGQGAGSRIRRLYPDSLTASPDSLVRAAFDVSGGVG